LFYVVEFLFLFWPCCFAGVFEFTFAADETLYVSPHPTPTHLFNKYGNTLSTQLKLKRAGQATTTTAPPWLVVLFGFVFNAPALSAIPYCGRCGLLRCTFAFMFLSLDLRLH